ncbi:MAG: DUF2007 domain-containing protein [Pseudomonadota bacterium]
MPYCPQCRTEYREGVTHCSDDGSALVPGLPDDKLTGAVLQEIYAAYHELEAERIRSLLEDVGIACFTRNLRRAAFPTGAGSEATFLVAVPQADAERAIALVQQARTDGVLSDEGSFVQ